MPIFFIFFFYCFSKCFNFFNLKLKFLLKFAVNYITINYLFFFFLIKFFGKNLFHYFAYYLEERYNFEITIIMEVFKYIFGNKKKKMNVYVMLNDKFFSYSLVLDFSFHLFSFFLAVFSSCYIASVTKTIIYVEFCKFY